MEPNRTVEPKPVQPESAPPKFDPSKIKIEKVPPMIQGAEHGGKRTDCK
ncbi:MAG: hypothetical protein ABIO72_00710 [Patescibacteria group bacterium]